ncbi:MAG: DUF4974 domain-containing protein [Arenibacter latericius]|nr:DUF4974 domain-containing protein [Arenibacter latericius]
MDQALISKYLLGEANEEEIERIYAWIASSPENKRLFILHKQKWSINAESETDMDFAWKQIKNKTVTIKSRKKMLPLLKYAAIIVLILATTFYFTQDLLFSKHSVPSNSEAITLILSDGKTEVLSEDKEQEILNINGQVIGVQAGTQLTYSSAESSAEETIYNTIKVPYGKRFNLLLADSTHITLNGGSTLKHPEKFILGKERRVFLQGEAFFEVKKDNAHPFIVEMEDKNVRVLGTKFNVSCYPEDDENNTVLVEGSIVLYESNDDNGNQLLLEPGHKASWKSTNPLEVSLLRVDTEIYTSWLEGKIIFRNTPFKEIRKRLERHYNIKIQNKDLILEDKKYTGTFDIESIQEVFTTLNETYPIRYIEENNTIIIY